MKFSNKMVETLATKKNIAFFLLIIVFLCISITIIFFSNNNTQSVKIDSNLYQLKYSGGSLNGNMQGTGTLSDSNGMLRIRGEFKDNKFYNGTIVIKTDNKKITMTGEFEDYIIDTGEMLIEENDLIILKKGSFKDGKLNGSGLVRISQNGEELYTYSGIFEQDLPKFES